MQNVTEHEIPPRARRTHQTLLDPFDIADFASILLGSGFRHVVRHDDKIDIGRGTFTGIFANNARSSTRRGRRAFAASSLPFGQDNQLGSHRCTDIGNHVLKKT